MKAVIETPLILDYVGGGCYRLEAPFRFSVWEGASRGEKSLALTFEVPLGFVTDLHSVPAGWGLRLLFPADIPGNNASAVGHDFLYRMFKVLRVSRKFADEVYLALAYAETADLPGDERRSKRKQAFVMYRAVRRFGWTAWGRGDGTPGRAVRKAMERLARQARV